MRSTIERMGRRRKEDKRGVPWHMKAMPVGWLEKTEAALNAVLGDYLEKRGNALAIEMGIYHQGIPIRLSAETLRAAFPRMSSRIVVFVHGMAEVETSWSFAEGGESYGVLLERELGMTPLFVRYNTGRHISQNGRDLAALLEELVEASPVGIAEITLIGHSMGGLVIRSACHEAEGRGHAWLARAKRAFYLGSPHLGAPLEKAGHLVSLVLGAIDEPVVRLTRTVADLRSAGVKDLRHGTLLDEEWDDDDLFAERRSLPLCAGMDHYFIAGALARSEEHVVSQLFGDALVRLASATDPGRRGGLPEDHIAVFPGVYHRELAHSPEVYAKIKSWLGARGDGPPCSDAPPDVRQEPPAGSSGLERVDAYRALLQDAVHHGATAVQQVQEELTARPYDWIERVPPLEAPAKIVRAAHFAAVRTAYDMTRFVNRLVGTALHEGIERLKRG